MRIWYNHRVVPATQIRKIGPHGHVIANTLSKWRDTADWAYACVDPRGTLSELASAPVY